MTFGNEATSMYFSSFVEVIIQIFLHDFYSICCISRMSAQDIYPRFLGSRVHYLLIFMRRFISVHEPLNNCALVYYYVLTVAKEDVDGAMVQTEW